MSNLYSNVYQELNNIYYFLHKQTFFLCLDSICDMQKYFIHNSHDVLLSFFWVFFEKYIEEKVNSSLKYTK